MCLFLRFHRIAPSARVCSERACALRRCARPPIARRLAVSIARPAPRVGGRARVVAFGAPPAGLARASAAGITWTIRTAKAEWAARFSHTSVVDAAGAIYVIGGTIGGTASTYYHDVYASTDGGARAGLGRGVGGVLEGVLEWVLRGTTWY